VTLPSRSRIIDWATEIYEDLDFTAARQWLTDHPGRKAAGFLPVYAPKEIIHAAGMLPVGIHGSGAIEIIRGDAYYQSYICHLPRSVVELAESGRLDFLSAALFPSTCDVIRNLSGMWQIMFPEMYVRYLDLPQVADPELGARFWQRELNVIREELGRVAGVNITDERLRASIEIYNEVRRVIGQLYQMRNQQPWKVPTEELYLLQRAGEVVDPEIFLTQARAYLEAAENSDDRIKDRSRVIIVGSFCEQPPLGLIKTIERAGCYIVDDDFLAGNRFLTEAVPMEGDPAANLADTFTGSAIKTSVLYEPDPKGKKALMQQRASAAGADGIIFCAASFCDPALLDRPMLREGAEQAGIPCIAFKFAENSGQFQQFREQAGTFSDSIKLWGDAS
jgi:benzoyl-CoA reductase subunit C